MFILKFSIYSFIFKWQKHNPDQKILGGWGYFVDHCKSLQILADYLNGEEFFIDLCRLGKVCGNHCRSLKKFSTYLKDGVVPIDHTVDWAPLTREPGL